MVESDLCGLVREHLHGPRGCPDDWQMGADVRLIRKIRKDRPNETYEEIAMAIQGVGQMRDDGWWGPRSRTMQFDMRVFFGKTKLGMPYYSLAKSRYLRAAASDRRAPTWLSSLTRPIESAMQERIATQRKAAPNG